MQAQTQQILCLMPYAFPSVPPCEFCWAPQASRTIPGLPLLCESTQLVRICHFTWLNKVTAVTSDAGPFHARYPTVMPPMCWITRSTNSASITFLFTTWDRLWAQLLWWLICVSQPSSARSSKIVLPVARCVAESAALHTTRNQSQCGLVAILRQGNLAQRLSVHEHCARSSVTDQMQNISDNLW